MYRPGPGQIFNSVKRSDLALQVCIINEQYVSKNHKILGTWNNKKKKKSLRIFLPLLPLVASSLMSIKWENFLHHQDPK